MSDTKEHILHVSFGLFLQKNFKEVTMQDIVEKTGMSKGAFYYYFKSKEQFFLEVINHFASALIMDYSKLSKDSLYQFYHDYIELWNNTNLSFLQDADSGFNYYALIFDALKLFPSFQERMITTLQVELKAWEGIVRIARANGEINSSLTDEQIASIFIYTNDGVGMYNVMLNRTKDTPNTLLSLWDGLYKGLKA
jgi:TetR/AcrR family transcriptional repressor of nem operon